MTHRKPAGLWSSGDHGRRSLGGHTTFGYFLEFHHCKFGNVVGAHKRCVWGVFSYQEDVDRRVGCRVRAKKSNTTIRSGVPGLQILCYVRFPLTLRCVTKIFIIDAHEPIRGWRDHGDNWHQVIFIVDIHLDVCQISWCVQRHLRTLDGLVSVFLGNHSFDFIVECHRVSCEEGN